MVNGTSGSGSVEESATVETATAFLQSLLCATPYRVHTVLTDNGVTQDGNAA